MAPTATEEGEKKRQRDRERRRRRDTLLAKWKWKPHNDAAARASRWDRDKRLRPM